MPKFSTSSKQNLVTVHPDLQTLFLEVITVRDCTIVSGLRSQEEQQALYAKGRTEPGEIVTYMDGIERRSSHQSGNAVDVIPYPEKWNAEAMRDFGNFVLGIAAILKKYRLIDHTIEWGGTWDWKDYAHFELL
jgi:peptidoglycan L-alanyl-D-glutamate endopeptidase CwlK